MAKVTLIILAILIALIIILSVAAAIGGNRFRHQARAEAAAMFARSQVAPREIITEAHLENLPAPVQRWLRRAGVVGKERIITVRLKQKGFFRLSESQRWMSFEAEQYYATDEPAFIWYTTMRLAPLLAITGRDKYEDGNGNMLIKLLSLIPVADAKGDEIDQGVLVRYLNETMWFPTAALSRYITWESVDENSAKATMSYKGVTASAIFQFKATGELTNMIATRSRSVGKRFQLDQWATPISAHREYNGILIPCKGEGVWKLSTGDFSYIKLEVTEIEYNNASIY